LAAVSENPALLKKNYALMVRCTFLSRNYIEFLVILHKYIFFISF